MWFSFTGHIPEIEDSNLTNIKFFFFPAKGPHTSTLLLGTLTGISYLLIILEHSFLEAASKMIFSFSCLFKCWSLLIEMKLLLNDQSSLSFKKSAFSCFDFF